MAKQIDPGANGSWGRAGTGLADSADWAVSASAAKQGAKYEEKTAAILDQFKDRAAILHDVMIPGARANIDHVVVSGKRVLLIDTKSWKPGFYWTMSGKSRRGRELIPHVDSKTMAMAQDRIRRALPSCFIDEPLTVVWPSNKRNTLWLFALRLNRSKAVHATSLERRVKKFLVRTPANASLVTALVAMLAKPAPVVKRQYQEGR